jgi:hypothetical protein
LHRRPPPARCHPFATRNQVDQSRDAGEQNQKGHPDRLDPAGRFVVTPKKVPEDLEQHQQIRDPGEDNQEVPEKIPSRTESMPVLV